MPLPDCSANVSPALREALRDLGRRWAADPARPTIAEHTLRAWRQLVEEWITDERLPLLVRKFRQNRGALVESGFGRKLVPTDNSPAQWVFAIAFDGICPSVQEVAEWLADGRIPVAVAFSGGEREGATYRGLLGRCPGTGSAGWKLAHLERVGLGGRGAIESFSRSAIEHHFRLLMSPDNMFVVPAAWAGLAEVDEFLEGFLEEQQRA